MTVALASPTPADIRLLCRDDKFRAPATANLCDGHVQANVIILPNKFAADFRALCARNPVPCPLLGETLPGDATVPARLAANADIRYDLPLYRTYVDGAYVEEKRDVAKEWKEDSVAFFIGCSYSFEAALTAQGLVPRHTELNRNVPMYRTKVPLAAAGVFGGNMVVSMRPYPLALLPLVRETTRPFVLAHGEPVAWGVEGARALGITDLDGTKPDFGDATEIREGEVAVYWGCGVTPQLSVMDSKIPGLVLSHAPGHMLVLDMLNKDVCV
ncbi:hypothetical protein BCR35DRAFT_305129 [Leucosporidium creatinivorum]|uniref:DUF1445 domain-containing protein n=1 Tax=Leucosporidium creatinivorum TaxID=106004 RepID=A0A1Y2F474_9BASI|nr:hypothetical protein BCR35DRAFT_305129 [Leucosporidium creatinivorum]